MRDRSVWARLPGVENTVVERVELTGLAAGLAGDGQLLVVAHVRSGKRSRSGCGICGRRCGGYDRGEGRRRWRALDLGPVRAQLEAAAPRVTCPEHMAPSTVHAVLGRYGCARLAPLDRGTGCRSGATSGSGPANWFM